MESRGKTSIDISMAPESKCANHQSEWAVSNTKKRVTFSCSNEFLLLNRHVAQSGLEQGNFKAETSKTETLKAGRNPKAEGSNPSVPTIIVTGGVTGTWEFVELLLWVQVPPRNPFEVRTMVELNDEIIKVIGKVNEALKESTFEVNRFNVFETGAKGVGIEIDIRKHEDAPMV